MSETIMNPADLPPSRQVTYTTEGIHRVHDMAQRTACRHLKVGASYTVERVHRNLDIFLREFPGIAFHIHLFAPV
jgi:hypothetical protein